MKKITFLVLHLNYGGIEKQVTNLANNLVDKYNVEILSLYNILGKSFYDLDSRVKVNYVLPYGPNKEQIIKNMKKLKVISFFKECIKALKIIYTKYVSFAKYINNINTDIIISTRIEFSNMIKRTDTLNISQEHSYIDTNSYKAKVKKSFKNIKYLIVMTNKAKDKYDEWLIKEKAKPTVIVIPNIIEKPIVTSKLDKKQIIAIGRLEEVKDFNILLDVFKIVNERNKEWKLKICGEGSKRKEIEEKINLLSLKDSVTLTGRIDIGTLNNEIVNSSIYVLTSKSESFSLSLVSCLAHGLPAVSFDIDVGPREIITENEDGFLVKNRNVITMAEKICRLIENEDLRKTYGKNASKNMERYYCYNIINKWYDILE